MKIKTEKVTYEKKIAELSKKELEKTLGTTAGKLVNEVMTGSDNAELSVALMLLFAEYAKRVIKEIYDTKEDK